MDGLQAALKQSRQLALSVINYKDGEEHASEFAMKLEEYSKTLSQLANSSSVNETEEQQVIISRRFLELFDQLDYAPGKEQHADFILGNLLQQLQTLQMEAQAQQRVLKQTALDLRASLNLPVSSNSVTEEDVDVV